MSVIGLNLKITQNRINRVINLEHCLIILLKRISHFKKLFMSFLFYLDYRLLSSKPINHSLKKIIEAF